MVIGHGHGHNLPINILPEFPAILKAYTKVSIMVMVMVQTIIMVMI